MSLSNSTSNRKIILKKVKDNILNKERRKEINTYYKSHAFVTESRGRSESRFSHSKQERESSNREENLVIENPVIEKANKRGRFQSRKGIKCYYCDKPRHIQKDCRKYKRDKKGKDEDKN